MIFGFSTVDLIVIIISILVAMSVHEAMHAYVGLRLGDTTALDEGRVSLNPLHHIDPITTVVLPIVTLALFHAPILAARPVPFNPHRVRYGEYGAALVALAGPMSNLAMAIVGAVLLHIFASNAVIPNVLFLFVSLNIALFIFNLVPIPPLDGSRVLYVFAPEPVQRIMGEMERYGLFIVFILVLIPGFSDALFSVNQAILRLLIGN